jgi:hypothetical protein
MSIGGAWIESLTFLSRKAIAGRLFEWHIIEVRKRVGGGDLQLSHSIILLLCFSLIIGHWVAIRYQVVNSHVFNIIILT